MRHHIRTCRFCKNHASDLLKYSLRSYAHPSCFLDAGHKLTELHAWQVANIPYVTLNKRGLVEEAQRIINAERDRQRALEEARKPKELGWWPKPGGDVS